MWLKRSISECLTFPDNSAISWYLVQAKVTAVALMSDTQNTFSSPSGSLHESYKCIAQVTFLDDCGACVEHCQAYVPLQAVVLLQAFVPPRMQYSARLCV